jgi:hypothetical protein
MKENGVINIINGGEKISSGWQWRISNEEMAMKISKYPVMKTKSIMA